MRRLCQRRLEQVRIARRVEKTFGAGAGEMQDTIDFAGQRSGGRLGKTLRRQEAINHDQVDLEIFAAQRSGKIARAFLAGEIKKPRRRLQTYGHESGPFGPLSARPRYSPA